MSEDTDHSVEPRPADTERAGATSAKANPVGEESGEPPTARDDSPDGGATADRAQVVGAWLTMAARWSLKLIVVGVALVLSLWAFSLMWAGLLPVILALILTALLSPMAQWLKTRGLGNALASGATLLTTLAVVVGVFVFVAPDVVRQLQTIGSTASGGFDQIQQWLASPPLEISTEQIDKAADQATEWLRSRSGSIASGAFSGASAIGGVLINTILILALTFLLLKDGHRFPAWQRSLVGRGAGAHLTEVLARNWKVLGGFIRTQALVSAIDAVLIGAGLLALQVPLALALTVITFFAGFIPIIGAITAGGLAVLVALVTNGWQTALAVLALIVVVQQIEGNVLSPMLQGKTMSVHPALILVAVTIGGTLFGIIGVFLAVPLTASIVATTRYVGEQLDLRTGDATVEELDLQTDYGEVAAKRGKAAAAAYRTAEADLTAPDPSAPDSAVTTSRARD
ncbi:AI-2E family transporter [soil metagenome]